MRGPRLLPGLPGERRLSIGLAAFVAASLLCATAAQAQPANVASSVDGRQAIAFLNDQRVANRIPAITSINQALASPWCPNEDAGAWLPGEMARDWSSLTAWGTDTSPWDDAPMHQFSMYDPLFTAAGDVNAGGACMGLGNPVPQPVAPTFYAFVSDAGPSAVPDQEIVEGEGPFAPQNAVGIAEGTPTGPQPLLYALGFPGEQLNPSDSVHAVSWSLRTASGAAVPDVRMADEKAVAAYGYPGYMAVGGAMVPPPLQPGTTYRGRVIWQGPTGRTATQTCSFSTAPASPSASFAGPAR